MVANCLKGGVPAGLPADRTKRMAGPEKRERGGCAPGRYRMDGPERPDSCRN